VKPKSQSLSPADPAVVDEQLRQWVAQWRVAGAELKKQKRAELRALSDSQAIADADMLLNMVPGTWMPKLRETSSGLVEQQRIFSRLNL
jgi:hypothetical protein